MLITSIGRVTFLRATPPVPIRTSLWVMEGKCRMAGPKTSSFLKAALAGLKVSCVLILIFRCRAYVCASSTTLQKHTTRKVIIPYSHNIHFCARQLASACIANNEQANKGESGKRLELSLHPSPKGCTRRSRFTVIK